LTVRHLPHAAVIFRPDYLSVFFDSWYYQAEIKVFGPVLLKTFISDLAVHAALLHHPLNDGKYKKRGENAHYNPTGFHTV
ncbi:hypothetical protein RSW84_29335, partial [Escherichia coli]